MCVADHLGCEDPDSVAMTAARSRWPKWCERVPDLAVVAELDELREWTRTAQVKDKDRVVGALAQLTRDDQAAATVIVWLLVPGATRLAGSLRDLSPDIDALVAGQLWLEARRSHELGPRCVAKAILANTRREVCAELGVGALAKRRDRVWAETLPWTALSGDRPNAPRPGDPRGELMELLDSAIRNNALEGFEIWLIYELASEATKQGAPMRRGMFGLTAPSVIAPIARCRPESARTLRRRAKSALEKLTEYAEARRDDVTLARWIAAHPWRPMTAEEAFYEEMVYTEEFIAQLQAAEWDSTDDPEERRDESA